MDTLSLKSQPSRGNQSISRHHFYIHCFEKKGVPSPKKLMNDLMCYGTISLKDNDRQRQSVDLTQVREEYRRQLLLLERPVQSVYCKRYPGGEKVVPFLWQRSVGH